MFESGLGERKRRVRRLRNPRGRVTGAVALLLAQACYSYMPAVEAPSPGRSFVMSLTDRGRAELADRIGPGVTRIEGQLVENTGTDYVLSVESITTIQSGVSHWAGERVSVNRELVANVQERRFSRGRTAVAVAALVSGVALLAATRDLLGFGTSGHGRGDPPGNEQ